MPPTVRMVAPEGGAAVDIPVEDVQIFADRGYTPQDNAARAADVVGAAREEHYSSPAETLKSAYAAGARGLTGGLSDVAIRAVGGDDARRELEALREYNPTVSTVAEIGGSLSGAGVGGLASKLGTRIAGTGGGALRQVARAGVKGSVEGAVIGAGQGVSEVALSDDLSLERMASTIGSSALFGGFTGGVAGSAAKGLEKGLARAKRALDDVAGKGLGKLGQPTDDLAKLDRKGLRAAEKTELDAIEATRVPRRAELADEIKLFRKELKENKLWLATKGADDAEIRAIGKRTLKADRALDNVLDDPKALAENPRAALSQLRKQEAALDELVNKHGDNLRAKFAGDASGDRVKALDFANVALGKNRTLQAKIGDLAAKPASERLGQIADAVEGLSTPKPQAGLASEMLGGSVFGHVAGAFSGLPIIGPMIGAKVARTVQNLVSGKLGAASAQTAARASKAVGAFLDATAKVVPRTPVIATQVLSRVAYAPGEKRDRAKKPKKEKLPELFRKRSAEIRSQIMPGPDGSMQMHPSARAKMAERLAPIRAASPVLADRMETAAARRLEYLASKLPRRPEASGMQIGPDTWQPSDMEMRTFARYAAAVEDPAGVVERLATGQVTPEDADAMREVYPEMYADIQRQIISQLPTLQRTLPYERRLSLSMFSGLPVDPALDPRVLRVLQGSFSDEEGSEQGTQAPMPQAQFGSVSKPEATPAQQRGG